MPYLVLIPLLPALAFALLAPMPRTWRNSSLWVSVLAIAASAALSVAASVRLWPGGEKAVAYHWSVLMARLGGVPVEVGLLLDPVSSVMMLVITLVGLAVQVYSLAYMRAEERRGWYFAVISLFSAAMLVLVLADGYLLLYMSWEVMGLCSYLLIGFWHHEEEPRRASIKAFLTTGVGDVGFAVALAAMFAAAGSFAFETVLPAATDWAPAVAAVVAGGLLLGAMGKSAQVPLHVWLPDAMAGPTPASALIHAATMVAAGVYLIARSLPVFQAVPVMLDVTMVVGLTTALVAGLLALVQYDIKRVLAYSTISQLGYMFAALAVGSMVAGVFHLVTHAFFKSLLFLGAGVVIHGARTQDMRKMGGLAKDMPWTASAFTVGALALAGVFPLSGFFSKDEILTVLWEEGHPLAFVLALGASFVTAFYVSRLWTRVFFGKSHRDAHEGHPVMIAPMVGLAAVTLAVGLASPLFARFMGHEGQWPRTGMALLSSAVSVTGLLGGWLVYGRGLVDTERLRRTFSFVYTPLTEKLYFDALYEWAFIRPALRLSETAAAFDLRAIDGVVNGTAKAWKAVSEGAWAFDTRAVDGAVNRVGKAIVSSGARVRRLQVGKVQSYQRMVLAALLVLLVWMVLKGA